MSNDTERRESALADHRRVVASIDLDEAAAKQDFAARRAKAEQTLQRELALLDARFCDAWKQMIVAGTAPQYKASRAAYGRCTFGGRVSHGQSQGSDAPQSFAGIDIVGAVLDTYQTIRRVGVPVAHVQGIGGIQVDPVGPAHTRFNATVYHDLPDCSAEDFEVNGYQVMIDDEGRGFRFSVAVDWKSKSIVEAPALNGAEVVAALTQRERETLLSSGGIIIDAGPTSSGKTL
jgi:hypothetical protein